MCCHVLGPLSFGFVFRQFEEGKGEIQSVFKTLTVAYAESGPPQGAFDFR